MTAGLILFVVAIVVCAAALSDFLRRRFAATAPGPWETAASIGVLSFILAIGVNWMLSWGRLVARGPLLVTAIVLALPSAIDLYRNRTAKQREYSLWAILPLAPIVLWISFCLWRGAIVPVLSHDALSYHLPKAVMMARAHQYAFFPAPDPRISTSPPNYEFLLADVILLTGSDAVTEWIATAAFVVFLLLAAAVLERWWGEGPHLAMTILLLAAVPVILLHTGAHKNDLLSNVFYLAALLWGGRWLATQETAPLWMALLSLAAGAGTKLQGVFIAAALFAVWIVLAFRRRVRFTRAQFAIVIASILIGLLALGGWPYVANFLHTGQAALPASSSSDAGYGDWRNLWEVPLLMLMRPFDPGLTIHVPWRGERWFWPYYELYFSDYGALTSLFVLFLPFAILRYKRRWSGDAVVAERVYTSMAAVLAFVLMLPIRIRPLGFFAGFPRYFVFIVVFVLAWTIAPVIKELWLRKKTFLVQFITAAAAVVMIVTAAVYAINDAFQPLDYVLYAAERPGLRQPYFAKFRAGTVADALAGPTDTIAVQGGFDSWIYPLYGATLQRKVLFLEAGQPIPAEAKFVVVDRAWSVIWGHPRFEHMGQFRKYLGRGKATGEDLAVIDALSRDRERYELVYAGLEINQAVFRRRQPRSGVPTAGPSGSERTASAISGK